MAFWRRSIDDEGVLFSVIVPAYQVENYIGQCIESLLPQCAKNSEIIIVDDGSTDKSGKIADDYAKRFEYINVIHQKNGGPSKARNTGIHHANGKYCVFVDGDDMLCENAINGLMKSIEDNREAEVIIHRWKELDFVERTKECRYKFDGTQMHTMSISEVYRQLQRMPDLVFAPWLFSVRTDYIIKNNLFFIEGLLHEDEEWVSRVLLNTDKISYNNTCFYCYRVNREGSTMNTQNIKKGFDKLRVIDLLNNKFSQSKYPNDIQAAVRERCQKIFFGAICSAWQYRKDEKYDDLIRLLKKKRPILKGCGNMKHKVCYLMISLLGIRITCFCFMHVDKARLFMKKLVER